MIWVIIIGVLFIVGIIFSICEKDIAPFLIVGILILTVFMIGAIITAATVHTDTDTDLTLADKQERILYNLNATADEAVYVKVKSEDGKATGWCLAEDDNPTGKDALPFNMAHAHFYEQPITTTPTLKINKSPQKIAWFSFASPPPTLEYELYIPEDTIKYEISTEGE